MEVMTTLHGSTYSLQRLVRGCIPLESTIALTKDPLKNPSFFFWSYLDLIGELISFLRFLFLDVVVSESL